MSVSPDRKGYEFSKGVKNYVRERARGRCEWIPEPCRARGTSIDHITSIMISRLLNGGEPDRVVKTPRNAQLLCDYHNRLKTHIEVWMTRQLERQLGGGNLWR